MEKNFNWGRMNSTPAGAMERKEEGTPMEELVPKFERQAIRDLDVGNAWAELTQDIEGSLDEIVDGNVEAARRLVERHKEWLIKEKSLTDEHEQIAYIIAIAKEIKRRKGAAH